MSAHQASYTVNAMLGRLYLKNKAFQSLSFEEQQSIVLDIIAESYQCAPTQRFNKSNIREGKMYQLPLNFEQILTLVEQLPEDDQLKLSQVLQKDEPKIIEKWQYLREHHQELDESNPLSNSEIDIICQYLAKQNQTRPLIKPEQKIDIPDNFNDPLPDEILNAFYQ